jgi:hypothetical protein
LRFLGDRNHFTSFVHLNESILENRWSLYRRRLHFYLIRPLLLLLLLLLIFHSSLTPRDATRYKENENPTHKFTDVSNAVDEWKLHDAYILRRKMDVELAEAMDPHHHRRSSDVWTSFTNANPTVLLLLLLLFDNDYSICAR